MSVGRPKKGKFAIVANDDSLFWQEITTIQQP